jgi:hypothetical protein
MLIVGITLSCGRDAPVPASATKHILVPPRDTAAIARHRKDSVFIVLRAVAALPKTRPIEGYVGYRLMTYQHTDSGTIMSFVPVVCVSSPTIRCAGGGGRVFVDSLGKAKLIELYR